MESVDITQADLTKYSYDRLDREMKGIHMSLEMLYTKNNSLEGADLIDGGGSPSDQAEFQRLKKAEDMIVAEINRRHALEVVDGQAPIEEPVYKTEAKITMPESIDGPGMDLSVVVAPPEE